jgi:hypothetical protein
MDVGSVYWKTHELVLRQYVRSGERKRQSPELGRSKAVGLPFWYSV